MKKRLIIPLLIVGFCGSMASGISTASKMSREDALDEVRAFIDHISADQGIILEPLQRERFFKRANEKLDELIDSRGYVRVTNINYIKNQFINHAKTLHAEPKATVSYYAAIKKLKELVFDTYEKQVSKAAYNAKQALWFKVKTQLIDKELRAKAFIAQLGNEELVVKRSDLDTLSAAVIDRVKDLAATHPKKKDRVISLGYAESKVRDLLRRAGYRNQSDVKIIMKDVANNLKKETASSRVALSKVEELTVAAMKRFKRNNPATSTMSRLAAEVAIFKDIKKAKLSSAEEITAINEMTEILSRNTSRDKLTKEFVAAIANNIVNKIKTKQTRQQKKARAKKVIKKKHLPKKEQKRGKRDERGRWGNLKRQS